MKSYHIEYEFHLNQKKNFVTNNGQNANLLGNINPHRWQIRKISLHMITRHRDVVLQNDDTNILDRACKILRKI